MWTPCMLILPEVLAVKNCSISHPVVLGIPGLVCGHATTAILLNTVTLQEYKNLDASVSLKISNVQKKVK